MTAAVTSKQDPSSVVAAGDTARDSSQGLVAGRQIEQLGLLTLAIVLAGIGFALHFVWFLALLVLVLLWGYEAVSLRGSRSSGGLVSAIAGAAVAEARAIAVDVSAHATSAEGESAPTSSVADTSKVADDATKAELYDQARQADVAGRSTMTKSELRTALVKED